MIRFCVHSRPGTYVFVRVNYCRRRGVGIELVLPDGATSGFAFAIAITEIDCTLGYRLGSFTAAPMMAAPTTFAAPMAAPTTYSAPIAQPVSYAAPRTIAAPTTYSAPITSPRTIAAPTTYAAPRTTYAAPMTSYGSTYGAPVSYGATSYGATSYGSTYGARYPATTYGQPATTYSGVAPATASPIPQ